LALLPPAEPAANRNGLLDAEFAQLEAAHRQRLAIAIGVLRAPAKIAYLHHTIADETVSRGMLAWSASVPDSIVAVARSGGIRRISFYQAASLKPSITRILDADRDLSDDEIGCKLPSMAVLTFLAILDQLRAVRLYSMLNHTEPSTMFSPDEILDRLAGAAEEDFRWPLLFTDKVVPGMAAALTRDDVSAAFRNLIQANLIEPVIETERSKRYDLTEAGQAICHGVLHDFSKVALSLCDHHPDGQYGHDLVLLIRGPFHLYLFAMAGQEGAVAAVNNHELESVLNRALAPAWASTATAVQPSAPASSAATAVCPQCGGAIAPGQRFCQQCGRAVAPEPPPAAPAAPRVCPGCGHAAVPDTQFCGNCGRLLT
jgi:predicted nucleic acid-binding Zn ribbon protein